jgi:hypothetical protein
MIGHITAIVGKNTEMVGHITTIVNKSTETVGHIRDDRIFEF